MRLLAPGPNSSNRFSKSRKVRSHQTTNAASSMQSMQARTPLLSYICRLVHGPDHFGVEGSRRSPVVGGDSTPDGNFFQCLLFNNILPTQVGTKTECWWYVSLGLLREGFRHDVRGDTKSELLSQHLDPTGRDVKVWKRPRGHVPSSSAG